MLAGLVSPVLANPSLCNATGSEKGPRPKHVFRPLQSIYNLRAARATAGLSRTRHDEPDQPGATRPILAARIARPGINGRSGQLGNGLVGFNAPLAVSLLGNVLPDAVVEQTSIGTQDISNALQEFACLIIGCGRGTGIREKPLEMQVDCHCRYPRQDAEVIDGL